jgi:flagellar hook-associated protein FlgK
METADTTSPTPTRRAITATGRGLQHRPLPEPGLARPALPGQIGKGVQVDAIVRLRTLFLDMQYHEESTVLGYWDRIEQC